jgi:pimeloyl-ACP methyl ester carboxylesterase
MREVIIESHYVEVDGIRTHYLEGGAGPTVVLLHSGEFGAAAEISWEHNLAVLAEYFHVVAPDWLGFGRTDKLRDFVDGRARLYAHMQSFLDAMGIVEADFIGNSFAGGMIAKAAASDPPLFPFRRIILASGGGFTPANEARAALHNYDCTFAAMQRLLAAMFHDAKWAADSHYVQRRLDMSNLPGAWECTAASRIGSPMRAARTGHGQPDTVEYEKIPFPTLVIVGANDKLRLPGYADEMMQRLPNAHLLVFEDCGHCPNIEQAARFNHAVIGFLSGISTETPSPNERNEGDANVEPTHGAYVDGVAASRNSS